MTVREIFALRKQGHIEEAYEAIKARYANYRGHYTTLCMFWTASDVFKKRLAEGRIEEASKIYKALQRVLPNIDDKDGKCAAFMQYAERRLSKATTNQTDSTDKEFSNSIILDSEKDSCNSSERLLSQSKDSCSSKENPCHPSDSCSSKLSRLLSVVKGEMSVREMMAAMGFASRDKFLKNYLSPALKAGLVEMTDPDSPKSPKQRYRRAKGDM